MALEVVIIFGLITAINSLPYSCHLFLRCPGFEGGICFEPCKRARLAEDDESRRATKKLSSKPTCVAAKPTPSGSLKVCVSLIISFKVCKRAGVIFLTGFVLIRNLASGA